MKLSFKNSRFLMTSFAALTLVGHSGSALGGGPVTDEDLSSEVTAITATAIEYDDEATGSCLLALPEEIISLILTHMDTETLFQTVQTSSGLRRLVKDEMFQRDYGGLTPAQYVEVVKTQVPVIFGKNYGAQIKAFLAGKPMYAYARLLARLIEPDNLAVLQANGNALLKSLRTTTIKDVDGVKQHLNIAKALAIASYADQLFILGMDRNDRSIIIKALAPLSSEQIAEVGLHADQLFIPDMNGYHRTNIIKALAPFSPDQIAEIGNHADHLFTPDMESDRAYIIQPLALLSPDRIAVVSTRFEEGDSFWHRLQKIYAYIEELRTSGKLMSQ